MNLNTNKIFLILILIFSLFSCKTEFNQNGYELLSDNILTSSSFFAPVYFENKEISDIQTNNTTHYQLGNFKHSFFGQFSSQIISQLTIPNNPIFGRFSQDVEDSQSNDPFVIQENEKINEVFLEIPFFVNNDDSDGDGVIDQFDSDPNDIYSDSDLDGVSDFDESLNLTDPLNVDTDSDGISDLDDEDNTVFYSTENSQYRVDSIYGNRLSNLNLKVNELTYYLSNLDPDNNFETSLKYFSSDDFLSKGFYGKTLYDDQFQLDFNEIRLNYKTDDPKTDDIDETKTIETRLTPRLRIPLDIEFFQSKIIDKEGSRNFSNQLDFSNYLRGIIVQITDSSDDIYLLLNFSNALIRINYEFDRYNNNLTDSDLSDDFVYKDYNSFIIETNGITFNNFKKSTNNNIKDGDKSKIYLKGGLGHIAKIRLFESDLNKNSTLLDSIRNNNWLINEANLVFYVDQEEILNWDNEELADRIFLFDMDNSSVILDYDIDNSTQSLNNRNKYFYGGILEYDDNGIPYRYKFRITEYLRELLKNDDFENSDLGLSLTSDILNKQFCSAILKNDSEKINIPVASVLNPMGTILVGTNPKIENLEKKLKLEIFYTDFSL
ncbi:MAG: hypothetical protein CMC40_06285 [Flavobacteriaceae bacterium]|nr:hypothetical protein [Flavobacteriaceae bacterium]